MLIFWNQLLGHEVDQVVQNVEGSVEVVTQEVNHRAYIYMSMSSRIVDDGYG